MVLITQDIRSKVFQIDRDSNIIIVITKMGLHQQLTNMYKAI